MYLNPIKLAQLKAAEASLQIPVSSYTKAISIDNALIKKRTIINDGFRVTLTDIIIKQLAIAILELPLFNSIYNDMQIVQSNSLNMNIAVFTENGTIYPVLSNIDKLLPHEIADEIKSLTKRTRAGSLLSYELEGAYISLCDLSSYGIDHFTPSLLPKQTVAFGLSRQYNKSNMPNKPLNFVNIMMSVDSRIIDHGTAAKFLQRFSDLMNLI